MNQLLPVPRQVTHEWLMVDPPFPSFCYWSRVTRRWMYCSATEAVWRIARGDITIMLLEDE